MASRREWLLEQRASTGMLPTAWLEQLRSSGFVYRHRGEGKRNQKRSSTDAWRVLARRRQSAASRFDGRPSASAIARETRFAPRGQSSHREVTVLRRHSARLLAVRQGFRAQAPARSTSQGGAQ